jgi:hypothetical protein
VLIQSPPRWQPRPGLHTDNPDWDRMTESLLGSIARAVPHAVGQGAEQVIDDAFDAWPVATGKSRDALELTYETTALTFTAQLDNGAPYARDIHDGETVVDLILTPAEQALPSIVAELERLIGRV